MALDRRRLFRDAQPSILNEATKSSIDRDVYMLKLLDPYVGALALRIFTWGHLSRISITE